MTPSELREARQSLGLTQTQLAHAMGFRDRKTIENAENEALDRPLSGPATRLLTYMLQGVIAPDMAMVVPEHVVADGGDGQELLIRLHRPRFLAIIADGPADGCDSQPGPTGEWINVVIWIDDPSVVRGCDTTGLLRHALTWFEIYTQDAFLD